MALIRLRTHYASSGSIKRVYGSFNKADNAVKGTLNAS
jgi:hypothetical protein